MRSEDELKELTRRAVRNEIFVGVTEEEIKNAFMMMISFAEFPPNVVALYGDYNHTFGRALNGFPIFAQCGYLVEDEYITFIEHYNRYQEALSQ